LNFISFAFVALFLAVTAVRLSPWGRTKLSPAYIGLLLFASLVFYAWHIPIYLAILLTSITVDYVAGIVIENAPAGSSRRKALLIVSLAANLGLLGVFKYGTFFLTEAAQLAPGLGRLRYDVVLPMGISFYTFASMSYTIDVYRGRLHAVRSYPRFMFFVCFFPHLVAGPIVRATAFLYQLPRRRRISWRVWSQGAYMMIAGLFLKIVVADNIAGYLVGSEAWDQASQPGANATLAVMAAFLFSAQIFGDFAGYSSMAIGIAYLLGFKFPVNFNAPYIAASFTEFWRRWHITLSEWLRDYLYIPLGGNRRGAVRTYVNLLTVMVLGGLWHGAAWTFVIWGAIHGGALAVERALGVAEVRVPARSVGAAAARAPLPVRAARGAGRFAWFLVVQTVVVVAWVFFRSADVPSALAFLRPIWQGNFHPVRVTADPEMYFTLLLLIPPAVLHLRTWLGERHLLPDIGFHERALTAGVMFYAILTLHGRVDSFIYFQF
jgi:alginate O-acetyltransferase complex protein AlgI